MANLIGENANQVPINGMLGDLAYKDASNIGLVGNFESTGIDDNAASTSLTIDDSGKVGIGTTAPASKLDVNGTVTAGGLSLGDNEKAQFGASDDLQIYHDGSNSYIKDNGSGTLRLQGSSSILMQKLDGEIMMIAREDGAVELNHNGSQKIKTTSTGVDVTGNVSLAYNGKATFGASDDLQIFHDGSNSRIKDAGTGGLYVQGTSFVSLGGTNGEMGVLVNENSDVQLYYNNVKKLATTDTGVAVTGDVYIGGSSYGVGTVEEFEGELA